MFGSSWLRSSRKAQLRHLADALGLVMMPDAKVVVQEGRRAGVVPSGDFFACGKVGELSVTIEIDDSAGIVVDVRGELPMSFSFTPRGVGGPIAVGDPNFDDVLGVTGNESCARACLDAEIRARLRQAGVAQLSLTDGILVLRGLEGTNHVSLLARTSSVIGAAEMIRERSRQPPERMLLQNAMNEPEVAVRDQNVECLLANHPESSAAKDAMAHFLAVEEPVWSSAARLLLHIDPPPPAEDLARMFDQVALRVRPRLVEALCAWSAVPEATLLRFLVLGETAAPLVRTLSARGTITAVEPLLRFEEEARGAARSLARAAIVAIQSRTQGAGQGQLAVAEARDAHGDLSVAAPSGSLSTTDKGDD